MSTDLKEGNKSTVFAILAAFLLICAGFQSGFYFLPKWTDVLLAGAASASCSAVLVLLTNLLPHDFKHKLVFTRYTNEMPGGRVHRLCKTDPRIEYEKARVHWPGIFTEDIDEMTRNSRWYQQIYKPVNDSNEVRQAHRNFLLYREVFSGLLFLLVSAITWKLFGDPNLFGEIVPAVFYVLSGATMLSLIAARNSGNRFVVNAVVAAFNE